MARHLFGYRPSEEVCDRAGNVRPGAEVTIWDAETAGSQITDLVALGTATVNAGTITTDTFGRPTVQGPDLIVQMWAQSGSGNGRWLLEASDAYPFTRATVTETTGSLADGAQESGSIALAGDVASFRALKVVADRASRVRAYTTTAKRDADVARAPGTDPTGDHGVIFDVVFTASLLSIELNPTADGYLPGTAGTLYSTVDNLSGSTSTVEIVLTYLRTE